jgi:hypothetical protein
MPQFVDIHTGIRGVSPADISAARAKNVAIQHRYDVRFSRVLYDAGAERVFCFSEAPSKEAALAVHRDGNGYMPDEIFEVQEID